MVASAFEPLKGFDRGGVFAVFRSDFVVEFRRAMGRPWQALVPRGHGQYGPGTLAFERLPVGV